jgi:hypothetical protein
MHLRSCFTMRCSQDSLSLEATNTDAVGHSDEILQRFHEISLKLEPQFQERHLRGKGTVAGAHKNANCRDFLVMSVTRNSRSLCPPPHWGRKPMVHHKLDRKEEVER